jgi:hypothetical protein
MAGGAYLDHRFDADGSGFLDSEELKAMATKLWLPAEPGSPTTRSRSPSPTLSRGRSRAATIAGASGGESGAESPDCDDAIIAEIDEGEPDAVKLLLKLAAEADDGDGEISWEEFLELMQSLYHNNHENGKEWERVEQ